MGIQYRDNDKPAATGDGQDALSKLRDLINKAEKTNFDDPDAIKNLAGPEAAASIDRVQERINLLVDTMHEFLNARKDGKDTVAPMGKFIRLVQDTMIKYNAMEIGSIISTGMAAIAQMEQMLGKREEGFDFNTDNDN